MIDAFKDYLAPKRFGIVAYVSVIAHSLCGFVFTAVTGTLRASESGKFSCIVDAKSTATYKIQVDKSCFSRYELAYNSPLPLYAFVLLSIGSTVFVSVIYSLSVSKRVDEIESIHEPGTSGSAENNQDGENVRTTYVFHLYFIHLVIRLICGLIFTVMQYTFFYPNGFNLKFICNVPKKEVIPDQYSRRNTSRLNTTTVECVNPTASEKKLFGTIVFVINIILTVVIFGEVIFLLRRLPVFNCRSGGKWSSDTEFVHGYFLRKEYRNVPDEIQLASEQCNPCVPDETELLSESIRAYKQHILNLNRSHDINYIAKTTLDNLHVDVVIHTGRAEHKFSQRMERHELYDVYMEIPPQALRLEKVKDLFYPNQDTEGVAPRRILVIGRPGIGKTVLTEKVIRDWANGVDKYYEDKVAFVFKFRWFNMNELKDQCLKSFLQIGTRLLDQENFDSIYEEVVKEPQKAILVFDGLDELNFDLITFLDQSQLILDDPDSCMGVVHLFLKIFMGSFLKGATVLVTSRPTTDDFCSRVDFDRCVEIIGFTSEKIEEYVIQFCENNNRSDLKPKIWSHINSSSELLHLCYIPENCFIVCVTLSGRLSDTGNDTSALPTNLTELYQTAIDHFLKYHHRNVGRNFRSENVLLKLQQISFRGMEYGQLIFDQQLFDEETRISGLVNTLSNPIFPTKLQFCFIHLTIQEFLAARHVTETFSPREIETFISDHVTGDYFRQSKWHLVLQFIAGLLRKKMKMFDCKYRDCILTFAKGFEVSKGEIRMTCDQVSIMKYLKEVEDANIVKYVCERNVIKDAVKLITVTYYNMSSIDWDAVTFVCQHLNSLTRFVLNGRNLDCFEEMLNFLKGRCTYELIFSRIDKNMDINAGRVFMTLMNSKCTLKHEHVNLTVLGLRGFTNEGLTNIFQLFGHPRASHLAILNLTHDKISSKEISKLCEVLDDQHLPELNELNVFINPILDEGAGLLFDTLTTKGPRKLTKLNLSKCLLTHEFIPHIGDPCKLTYLSLEGNNLGDVGVRLLCDNFLSKEHCKLNELNIRTCSLTHLCIPTLCRTLQNEHCKLTNLILDQNAIRDEGVCELFEGALQMSTVS